MSAQALRRCAGSALACALLLLRSGAARADVPAPAAPAEAAPAEAAPADPAAELFRDAQARYTAGDVAGALDSMQRSYDLSRRPELLYNLGVLHRELGQCDAAAKAYAAYLAQTTQGRHREEAERASAELRAECPEEAVHVDMPVIAPPPPAAADRAPVPPAPPRYWTTARIVGWSSVGTAVVAGTGALYFALRGQLDVGRFEGAVGAGGPAYTRDEQAIYDEGMRANTWTGVLGLSALGLAATGVALVVLNPGGEKTSVGTVTLRLGTTASVQTFF